MLGLIILTIAMAVVSYIHGCVHQGTAKGCVSMSIFGLCVATLGGLGLLDMTILHPGQYGWGSWITAISYVPAGICMAILAWQSAKYRWEEMQK